MSFELPFLRPRVVNPTVTHDVRGENVAWIEDVAAPFLFGELDRVGEVPLLPEAAREAMRLLDDPALSVRDIAAVLRRDPGLCALLFRAANAPGQGASRTISTIPDAVMRLGAQGLRRLLFQASASRILTVRSRPDLTERLRVRSAAVALGSARVARVYGTEPEAAYVAGLLHDVGHAVVHSLCGTRGAPPELREPARADAVADALHERVGATVATRWNLPFGIESAIGHHHRPEDAVSGALFAYITAAGVRLCDLLDIRPVDRRQGPLDQDPVYLRLRLGPSEIASISAAFREELAQQAA